MTTYLGKSCSFGFLRVPFVNCRQFMYLVISLLVLRAGCGMWLYQFLIIAYHFTLYGSIKNGNEVCQNLVWQTKTGGCSVSNHSSSISHLDTIRIYASMDDAILRYANVSCCLKFNGISKFKYFKTPVINISCPLPKIKLTSYHYTGQKKARNHSRWRRDTNI